MIDRAEPARAWPEPDLRDAFANAPTALAVTTPAGIITAANSALAALLGCDAAALVGGTFLTMTHPDDVAGARRRDPLLPVGRPVSRGERRLRRGDGRVIWVTVTVSRLPGAGGGPAQLIVHVDDVTQRRQREAELHHRALHDPLTGLANRALLIDRITVAIAQLGRHARPSHLFYLDLDGFKTVSVGDCPVRGTDPADLLREADERMYRAKRHRRTAPAATR